MNLRASTFRRSQGNVLTVTLVIVAVLGIIIGSYLAMVTAQNRSVMRSEAWNSSMAMAEAGVEEALAQLNPGAPVFYLDRTANGWGAVSNGFYGPKTSTLTSGSYSVVYTDDKYPVLYSTGYCKVPAISATLTRTVRVTTTNVPLFSAAMAARDGIDLNGNSIYTDSFNSSLTNILSDANGRYISTKTSTNGNIASFAGVVNVANANVNGKVLLGPSATDAIKNNGTVTGGIENDFNFQFPDVVLPAAFASAASATANPTNINGVSYQYAFYSSGDYRMSSLNGSVYVAPGAIVRLYIQGDSSPPNIEVAADSTGSGSLAIYMGGSSFTLTGGSTVDGGKAANLSYYGLPTNTTISFKANATFTGTIYAPEAAFTLGGGGNNPYDFVGACVVDTVKVNGHYSFHYDEVLPLIAPMRGYVAQSWQEL